MAKAKSTCAADGCDRGVYCREMCSMHYNRWHKTADRSQMKSWQKKADDCAVVDCDSVDMARGSRGYCSMHYQRLNRTGDPGPAKPLVTKSVNVLRSDGALWRECPGCLEAKPDSAYHAGAYSGRSYYCRSCSTDAARGYRSRSGEQYLERRRARYQENLEENRKASADRYRQDPVRVKVPIWRSLGLDVTAEDYYRMHAEQGGRCAICSATEDENGKALALDHCHSTGRVRGLLCDNCNVGLGRFKDSPNALRRAITYLKA